MTVVHTNDSARIALRAGNLNGDFSRVTLLDLHHCPKLTALPALPAVRTVYLFDCPELTALPDLSGVTTLYLCRCPKLTSLPNLPAATKLYLYRCPKVTVLPALPVVTKLTLSHCPKLTALPDLPALTRLTIFSGTGLRALYTDERGYRLYRGGSVYVAGCRHFPDAAAALAHWGSSYYPDRARGDAYCAAIHAEELRRIETASG
jgi:hypothetical protein